MNKKRYHFWVIIMLTALFQSLGIVQAQADYPLLPRQVDLSGNIVQFSMTENFSRAFPADDMVDVVDLDNPNAFSEFGGVLILQRYWDFTSEGFFSNKNVGTLQMTLSVKKSKLVSEASIANPADLVKAISLDLADTYDEFNKNKNEDEKVRYSNLKDDFVEFQYNNQRWVRYSTWKNTDRELTSAFTIPITKTDYIVAAFAFAPAYKTSMREFIDDFAQPHVERIMETFRVKYNLANDLTGEIEKFSKFKLEDLTKK